MKTLKNTKKITLATLKSFAKRNSEKLFVKNISSFDGMVDCVMPLKSEWRKTTISDDKGYYRTGIQGIYTVGSSRDLFTLFEGSGYTGIEVYNCCGCSVLAVKNDEIEESEEYINFNELLK